MSPPDDRAFNKRVAGARPLAGRSGLINLVSTRGAALWPETIEPAINCIPASISA